MINKLKSMDINLHYFNRYKKLVNAYLDYKGEGEIHHILPKSIFVKFKNHKENKILVPHRVHFILHYILYKIFNSEKEKNKMTFAFNQMKRISNNSFLYKNHRKLISKLVSNTNKGRRHYHNKKTLKNYTTKDKTFILPKDCEWGQSFSENRKKFYENNILVKNQDGETFYVDKEEFKIRNDLADAKIGRKHSKETKELMSKNGIKGKYVVYDKDMNSKYIEQGEDIPKGFTKGKPEELKIRQSKIISKKKSWFNPITNESIRIEGEPPAGFIKGRGPFNNKGSKGMKFYHLGDKEIMRKEKPEGWFEGRVHKHFELYDNKDLLVGTFSKKQIEEEFTPSLLKATKEKPIGHNKAYLSRLKESVKPYIGFYIK